METTRTKEESQSILANPVLVLCYIVTFYIYLRISSSIFRYTIIGLLMGFFNLYLF